MFWTFSSLTLNLPAGLVIILTASFYIMKKKCSLHISVGLHANTKICPIRKYLNWTAQGKTNRTENKSPVEATLKFSRNSGVTDEIIAAVVHVMNHVLIQRLLRGSRSVWGFTSSSTTWEFKKYFTSLHFSVDNRLFSSVCSWWWTDLQMWWLCVEFGCHFLWSVCSHKRYTHVCCV